MDGGSAILAVQVSDPGLHVAAVTASPVFLSVTGMQD